MDGAATFKSAQAADTASATAPSAAVLPSSGPIPLGTAPNYRAIVAQNRGSVVGITIAGEMKAAAEQEQPFENPFGNDDNNPFSQFFRQLPPPARQPVPMHAQGSGFIVSSDGIILTNAHVVDGAKEVTVKLIDHREFKAKVLGIDKTSDIAVLKIDAHGLPAVRLGNSDQLGVGDYVLAIGAPFGLEETATAGIVSATGRSLARRRRGAVHPDRCRGQSRAIRADRCSMRAAPWSASIRRSTRTRAAIRASRSPIPINLAQGVEQQIVKTGKVEHGRLGVEIQNVNQSLAQSFKLSSPAGRSGRAGRARQRGGARGASRRAT